MDQAPLGRSGLTVSRLGFGCASLSGYDYGPIDEIEAVKAIQRAYDLGFTLFDTADVYGFGRAETLLREALGDRRHEVVIATKGGITWDTAGRTSRDVSPRHLREAVDASLSRLDVEAISLYQVHWLDGRTPLGDVVETLASLQEAGKIKHIGLCNVGTEDLYAAQRHGRVETLQLPFSLVEPDQGPRLAHADHAHGVGTLAYNVLGQGLLVGATPDPARLHPTDLRLRSHLFQGAAYEHRRRVYQHVVEEAKRCGRSAAQVAIRWVLEQEGITVALVGAKTRRQLEDNAGALGWQIDAHSLRRLEVHGTGLVEGLAMPRARRQRPPS